MEELKLLKNTKTIGKYRIVLKKLSSEGDENDVLILPRIPMTSSAGTKLPFVLKRLQFPIKVAFALTINRSQGQTFAGSLASCSQEAYGHMGNYMLLSPGVGIQTMYLFGRIRMNLRSLFMKTSYNPENITPETLYITKSCNRTPSLNPQSCI